MFVPTGVPPPYQSPAGYSAIQQPQPQVTPDKPS